MSLLHGHAKERERTRTYFAWQSMRKRCANPNAQYYANYGGRGIRVCKRWAKFENFLADMGTAPAGKSLDRINNNGNYSPKNCRWATPSQQARNAMRVRVLSLNGMRMSLPDWADRLGIEHNTLTMRLRYGWTVREAL